MNKRLKFLDHARSGGNNRLDRDRDELWYDPHTGAIGYGNTYGEHSFNNRPIQVHPETNGRPRETDADRVPFDPFDPPLPKDEP